LKLQNNHKISANKKMDNKLTQARNRGKEGQNFFSQS
jgi:hypothetical protein